LNVRLASIGDLVEPVRTWNPSATLDSTFRYVDLSAVDQVEKQIKFTVSLRGSEAPSRARQLISRATFLSQLFDQISTGLR
jgi:type I restriction enzyme S subunit